MDAGGQCEPPANRQSAFIERFAAGTSSPEFARRDFATSSKELRCRRWASAYAQRIGRYIAGRPGTHLNSNDLKAPLRDKLCRIRIHPAVAGTPAIRERANREDDLAFDHRHL
jgi:hypothetical protein